MNNYIIEVNILIHFGFWEIRLVADLLIVNKRTAIKIDLSLNCLDVISLRIHGVATVFKIFL